MVSSTGGSPIPPPTRPFKSNQQGTSTSSTTPSTTPIFCSPAKSSSSTSSSFSSPIMTSIVSSNHLHQNHSRNTSSSSNEIPKQRGVKKCVSMSGVNYHHQHREQQQQQQPSSLRMMNHHPNIKTIMKEEKSNSSFLPVYFREKLIAVGILSVPKQPLLSPLKPTSVVAVAAATTTPSSSVPSPSSSSNSSTSPREHRSGIVSSSDHVHKMEMGRHHTTNTQKKSVRRSHSSSNHSSLSTSTSSSVKSISTNKVESFMNSGRQRPYVRKHVSSDQILFHHHQQQQQQQTQQQKQQQQQRSQRYHHYQQHPNQLHHHKFDNSDYFSDDDDDDDPHNNNTNNTNHNSFNNHHEEHDYIIHSDHTVGGDRMIQKKDLEEGHDGYTSLVDETTYYSRPIHDNDNDDNINKHATSYIVNNKTSTNQHKSTTTIIQTMLQSPQAVVRRASFRLGRYPLQSNDQPASHTDHHHHRQQQHHQHNHPFLYHTVLYKNASRLYLYMKMFLITFLLLQMGTNLLTLFLHPQHYLMEPLQQHNHSFRHPTFHMLQSSSSSSSSSWLSSFFQQPIEWLNPFIVPYPHVHYTTINNKHSRMDHNTTKDNNLDSLLVVEDRNNNETDITVSTLTNHDHEIDEKKEHDLSPEQRLTLEFHRNELANYIPIDDNNGGQQQQPQQQQQQPDLSGKGNSSNSTIKNVDDNNDHQSSNLRSSTFNSPDSYQLPSPLPHHPKIIRHAIFYNIYIPHPPASVDNNDGSTSGGGGIDPDKAINIVQEQLIQISESDTTRDSIIYYVVLGNYESLNETRMDSMCQLVKRTCIQIHKGPSGNENLTLLKVQEYCSIVSNDDNNKNKTTTTTTANQQHNHTNSENSKYHVPFPTTINKVTYIHSKGTFHDNFQNGPWRRSLTAAALHSNCIHPPDDTCNVCGLQFYTQFTLFFPGNMWTADCSYVSRLLKPLDFQYRQEQTTKQILLHKVRNQLTTELYTNPTYKNPTRDFYGLDRYSAEHWIASHPTINPCDMDTSGDIIHVWLGQALPKTDFQWSMAPRHYGLVINHDNNKFAQVLTNDTLRLREYFLLPGNIVKWVSNYDGLVPPSDSWVWKWFPDGPYWYDVITKYGPNNAIDIVTKPLAYNSYHDQTQHTPYTVNTAFYNKASFLSSSYVVPFSPTSTDSSSPSTTPKIHSNSSSVGSPGTTTMTTTSTTTYVTTTTTSTTVTTVTKDENGEVIAETINKNFTKQEARLNQERKINNDTYSSQRNTASNEKNSNQKNIDGTVEHDHVVFFHITLNEYYSKGLRDELEIQGIDEQFRILNESVQSNRNLTMGENRDNVHDNAMMIVYYTIAIQGDGNTAQNDIEILCLKYSNLMCQPSMKALSSASNKGPSIINKTTILPAAKNKFVSSEYSGETLLYLYDYCYTNPTATVTYINNNGYQTPHNQYNKYSDEDMKQYQRQLIYTMTKAAMSKVCLSTLFTKHSAKTTQLGGIATTNPTCNVCGLAFFTLWTFFYPGNIWSADCSYVQELVPPVLFEEKMSTDVTGELLLTRIRGKVTSKLFHDHVQYFGIDQFAVEHWVGSHPSLQPCSMWSPNVSNALEISNWNEQYNSVFQNDRYFTDPTTPLYLPQKDSMVAPNHLDLKQYKNTMEDNKLRIRDYHFLPGWIIKWNLLYNDYPLDTSWIWDTLPDGTIWKNATKEYGPVIVVDVVTSPYVDDSL